MTIFGWQVNLERKDSLRAKATSNMRLINHSAIRTLDEALVGSEVRVEKFAQSISLDRQTHLQAYGLLPGHLVRVLAQSPVTVVQVEHTEIALERELAHGISIYQD